MEQALHSGKWEQLAARAQYKPGEIAKMTRVSLRTLQRHFKNNYKVTISDWLRSLRLSEAYARLQSGQRVKEVAYGLGFKQLSHFSREFKRMYGIAPSYVIGGERPKALVELKEPKAQPSERYTLLTKLEHYGFDLAEQSN